MQEEVGYCLREPSGGGSQPNVIYPVGAFMGGQGADAGGVAYSEKFAPTLRAAPSGSNQVPDVVYACNAKQKSLNVVVNHANTLGANDYKEPQVVVYPDVARTLTAEHDSSPCVDRGQNVVALDCRNMCGNDEVSGTLQAKNEGEFNLNFINPVVYSSGAFGTLSEGVGCLGTGTRATAEMVAVHDTTQITSPANYSNPKPGDACHPLAAQQHPPLAVYPEKTGSLCANSHPGSYTGQDAFNDMLPVVPAKPPRRYIVRRLTPLECCRLQGYPDGWTENISFDALSQEQVNQLESVRKTWADVNDKKYKPCKDRDALRKWFEGLRTDSAEYKAYGNSLAIPCSYDVIRRVANAIRRGE